MESGRLDLVQEGHGLLQRGALQPHLHTRLGIAIVIGGRSRLDGIKLIPLEPRLFGQRVEQGKEVGTLAGLDQGFDLGEFRYSAGAEIRIFLPIFQFPLRFIYAQNLDEQPGDRFETFQFAIGNTF